MDARRADATRHGQRRPVDRTIRHQGVGLQPAHRRRAGYNTARSRDLGQHRSDGYAVGRVRGGLPFHGVFGTAEPGKSVTAGIVQWARDGEIGLIPAAVLDGILLDRFPGRTLEELDQMDVGRWMRSLQAKTMLATERKRGAWLGAVLKTEDLTREEWEAIAEHDRLVSDG